MALVIDILTEKKILPGGVGHRDRGARGPMSPAVSWWGARPWASPGGLGPTPGILPLIWSPHDWKIVLLQRRLHRPAEEIQLKIKRGLETRSRVKTHYYLILYKLEKSDHFYAVLNIACFNKVTEPEKHLDCLRDPI